MYTNEQKCTEHKSDRNVHQIDKNVHQIDQKVYKTVKMHKDEQ